MSLLQLTSYFVEIRRNYEYVMYSSSSPSPKFIDHAHKNMYVLSVKFKH